MKYARKENQKRGRFATAFTQVLDYNDKFKFAAFVPQIAFKPISLANSGRE